MPGRRRGPRAPTPVDPVLGIIVSTNKEYTVNSHGKLVPMCQAMLMDRRGANYVTSISPNGLDVKVGTMVMVGGNSDQLKVLNIVS